MTTVIRAGDREREHTAGTLGLALAQGYLPMDEYEHRLGRAFGAHDSAELADLVADLPVGALQRNDPRRRAERIRAARLGVRVHLGAYLAGVVLMLGIWLAVGLSGGGWYFWPVWPIMGWGIGVFSHAIPISTGVGSQNRCR